LKVVVKTEFIVIFSLAKTELHVFAYDKF